MYKGFHSLCEAHQWQSDNTTPAAATQRSSENFVLDEQPLPALTPASLSSGEYLLVSQTVAISIIHLIGASSQLQLAEFVAIFDREHICRLYQVDYFSWEEQSHKLRLEELICLQSSPAVECRDLMELVGEILGQVLWEWRCTRALRKWYVHHCTQVISTPLSLSIASSSHTTDMLYNSSEPSMPAKLLRYLKAVHHPGLHSSLFQKQIHSPLRPEEP